MSHDPAGCPRSYCPECDAYGDGYSAGKTKALSEVSAAVLGRERTGEPAPGQPGIQAPPEAAGATGVGFASRPGGVS